jgi:hypothetical protein
VGRPRIHKDNAAKQKAYRERKAAGEVVRDPKAGSTALVRRVLAADRKAS